MEPSRTLPDMRFALHPALLAVALGFAGHAGCNTDGRLEPATSAGAASSGGAAGAESSGGAAGTPACTVVPTDTYHDRIEPLLRDDNPKTCNQCHLSGVDLGVFVRDTPCETMACLVDQGLVDLTAPSQSKILSWIERASPDSALITDQVIKAEYDGFLEWIQASASCPDTCAGATCTPTTADEICKVTPAPSSPMPAPDSFDCSDASLEQLFYDDVYLWRGRCYPCHFSSELKADPTAPRWIRVNGNCATSSVETMHQVIARGLINEEDPTQSLLLLKPLSEENGGVEHGGHEKFADTTDPAYVSFLDFIRHYAECQKR